MPMKILVVDDEADVELLLTQRFKKKIKDNELELSFAYDGQQAIETLDKNKDIDLILTDINMPVMDGLTFLTKIGGINSEFMSIIVSAYGDLDNIRSAMNLGAFDFITKPINFADLDATLTKSFRILDQKKTARREHDALLSIQQELNIAREIQQSMIPIIDREHTKSQGISVDAVMIPAKEVGGDFYDFFFIDDDKVGFCIADVSGKGVPAALFMTMTKTLLKAATLSGLSPSESLDYVNRFLMQDNDMCMFVSIFQAIINLKTGELTYANGGHNLPYMVGKDSSVAFIEPVAGMILGIQPATYQEKTIKFPPGGTIFIYTDGITEAKNKNEDLYGESRTEEFLKSHADENPEELCKSILKAVRDFAADEPQSDDITMMALRYDAPEAAS